MTQESRQVRRNRERFELKRLNEKPSHIDGKGNKVFASSSIRRGMPKVERSKYYSGNWGKQSKKGY